MDFVIGFLVYAFLASLVMSIHRIHIGRTLGHSEDSFKPVYAWGYIWFFGWFAFPFYFYFLCRGEYSKKNLSVCVDSPKDMFYE